MLVPVTHTDLVEQAVMDAAQDELLTTLADFLRLSVLLHELLIAHTSVATILSQVAKEVIEEEVEGL